MPEGGESVGAGELPRGEAGGPLFATALISLTLSKVFYDDTLLVRRKCWCNPFELQH